MEKNQKNTDSQRKSSATAHDSKDGTKQGTSSKKMMDGKSDSSSEKGTHNGAGKSAMNGNSNKGK